VRGVKIVIAGNGASVCWRSVAFFEVFAESDDISVRKKKIDGNSSAGPPTVGCVCVSPHCVMYLGCCAHIGLMVDGRVVFDVLFCQIVAAFVSVERNCSWDSRHHSHHKLRSMDLVFRGMLVWYVMPTAVELSIWMGVRGCGQPIPFRVCQRGTRVS